MRALDRVLMSGFYVVPLYYLPEQWVARWTRDRASGSRPRCSAICRKPGGARTPNDPGRHTNRARRPTAPTLDDLFRRAGVRRPHAVALIDPPNRENFTDGPPRRLTYAQADRVISAIAARLRRLGLQTDAVVACSLPNTVESVLALLGVMRAGMIAAPLPLLWRGQEMAAALRRIGAKAIITSRAHRRTTRMPRSPCRWRPRCFRSATSAASGAALPDGVMPFDDVFAAGTTETASRRARPAIPPRMSPR